MSLVLKPLNHRLIKIVIFLLSIFSFAGFAQGKKAPVVYPLGSMALNEDGAWLANIFDSKLSDNVEIVGLGEFSHGAHETYASNAKMIQYLVSKRGYRQLMFEFP